MENKYLCAQCSTTRFHARNVPQHFQVSVEVADHEHRLRVFRVNAVKRLNRSEKRLALYKFAQQK